MSVIFVDGIFNIDKPPGMTSMDVVRRVKRLSRQRRVGHGGTLDPEATGVLPICFGQATRIMDYLINSTKSYHSVVELGVSTDTYDAVGNVARRCDPSYVTQRDVEQALASFRGTIYQTPPAYSALKQGGRRLYEMARSGIEVQTKPRKVEVLRLDLLAWDPPCVTLEIECGRGVYIRALAHDLGEALGCGAYLKSLARLRSGPFNLSEAVSLDRAEETLREGSWKELLYPLDFVLLNLRAAVVEARVERLIRQGRPLPVNLRVPFSRPYEECRVYSSDGRFVAMLTFDAAKGQWQPKKVFSLAVPASENSTC